MSQREGHEWERVSGYAIACNQKHGSCENKASWSKTLFAVDKSAYDGGFYCVKCRDDEEHGHVPVPRGQTLQLKTTPEDVVDSAERIALRVALEQCRVLKASMGNPYIDGSKEGIGWNVGWQDALADVEAMLVLTIGD